MDIIKRRFLILFFVFITIAYHCFAGDNGLAIIRIGLPGLPDIFDFENGTTQSWEIDPDGGTDGYSSLINKAFNTLERHYGTGTHSLAFDIDCSVKRDREGDLPSSPSYDPQLCGKGRFKILDHGDLSGKNGFKLRFNLKQVTGVWGGDWLGVVLFFWYSPDGGVNWSNKWGWDHNGNGWAPPRGPDEWTEINWDISTYGIDLSYISEVGFEILGGKNSTGTAVLYIDKVEFTE